MMKYGVTNDTGRMPPKQAGMNRATDSVSRNIRNQIANAQKKLQELSSNEEMTTEQKMKRRQEIKQEITSLNQQLRQHQIEQRKEKQVKASSAEDLTGGRKTEKTASEEKGLGMSQTSMQALVSAGNAMKQAKVQGSTVTKMEGRAGVLESEIKLDAQRGMDTAKKEEELADMQKKAQAAAASQIETLTDINKNMQVDHKNEDDTAKTEEKNDKEGKTELPIEKSNGADEIFKKFTYTPVDVYL